MGAYLAPGAQGPWGDPWEPMGGPMGSYGGSPWDPMGGPLDPWALGDPLAHWTHWPLGTHWPIGPGTHGTHGALGEFLGHRVFN